ncbi:unnamed protein product (plasmid) [Mycetohabitans rhizoxinica HKI 454]|uniref:Uncharacterized protein n=1 Tax=Mycetohabitans rhizoxinica (strain DSM 19002 / CIP 109453 / HKI 454) TaxID=882378 RepID=E5AW11_MYCRK|nr:MULTISPECIES: hypothetical protein [Mycetohabitans]CBW77313.1 unnamed protein product [Mycetohabitans rhizoxinica HKI 454]
MKKMLVLAFMMAALSSAVYAQKGSTQRGGMCFTNHLRIESADIVWKCEHIGQSTIKQIYEKGFRVVGAFSSDLSGKTGQFQYLVIEEQKK